MWAAKNFRMLMLEWAEFLASLVPEWVVVLWLSRSSRVWRWRTQGSPLRWAPLLVSVAAIAITLEGFERAHQLAVAREQPRIDVLLFTAFVVQHSLLAAAIIRVIARRDPVLFARAQVSRRGLLAPRRIAWMLVGWVLIAGVVLAMIVGPFAVVGVSERDRLSLVATIVFVALVLVAALVSAVLRARKDAGRRASP